MRQLKYGMEKKLKKKRAQALWVKDSFKEIGK